MTHDAAPSGVRRLLGWLCPYWREMRVLIESLRRIEMKLSVATAQMAETAAQLAATAVQLDKVAGEVVDASAALQEKIDNLVEQLKDVELNETQTAAVTAVVDGAALVGTKAQALDDLTPVPPTYLHYAPPPPEARTR